MVTALQWIIFGLTNATEGGMLSFLSFLTFPWPLIVMFGWGAGLAAHGVETYYMTGERARNRLYTIHDELAREFGANWQRADRKELRKVRNRVNETINKKREWFQHFPVYICINIMLWAIFLFSDGDHTFPWPLLVSIGWGIGLAAHGMEYLSHSSRESAISSAVEQERDRLYNGEKPKRDRHQSRRDRKAEARGDSAIRLTEDGELTDSMVEQFEDEAKSRRSRR